MSNPLEEAQKWASIATQYDAAAAEYDRLGTEQQYRAHQHGEGTPKPDRPKPLSGCAQLARGIAAQARESKLKCELRAKTQEHTREG